MLHRTSGRVLLSVAAFVLLLVPVAAIAGSQTFKDVPPTDWAFEDVEWLAANRLTKGCGDGTTFCPDDPVSRREMAAFTHRLATSTVVDAATAMDADKLDGKDSTAFAVVARADIDGDDGVHTSLTPIDAATVTIKAPTRGMLLIWGSATMWNGSGSDQAVAIHPYLNGVPIGRAMFGSALDFGADSYAESNVALSLTTAAEVTTGTHTVVLKAGVGSGPLVDGRFFINRANLVVQFVADGQVTEHIGVASEPSALP